MAVLNILINIHLFNYWYALWRKSLAVKTQANVKGNNNSDFDLLNIATNCTVITKQETLGEFIGSCCISISTECLYLH